MEKMTFLDFFAGIGTIRIGFEQAGWTCNGHVEWDKFAQASYNAMHDIKDGEFCGWDIREVRADELPRSDLWTFGAPCQDFSIAGKRKGMVGERSSLVNEIFRLIEETKEENRPTWLLYENVKGMLSSNGGWDFLGILLEMDRLGYDVEWQLLNSKHFGVPQNRERVFTIGHLRGRGGRKVFPITGQGGQTDKKIITLGNVSRTGYGREDVISENGISPTLLSRDYKGPVMVGIKQVGQIYGTEKEPNPQAGRIISPEGISQSLDTCSGGNRMPKIMIREATKQGYAIAEPGDSINLEQPNSETRRGRVGKGVANTLTTSCQQGVLAEPKQDRHGVMFDAKSDYLIDGKNFNQRGVVHGTESVSRTLISSSHSGNEPKIAIPVSSPEYQTKNQNGRRFKEDGDPMFTLTAKDRHGVAIMRQGEPKVIDDQGRVKDSYKQHDIVPTLRAQTHGNPPKILMRETDDGFHLCRNDEKKSSIQGTHVTYPDGTSHCLTSAHKPMTIDQQYVDGNPTKIIDALYNNRPPREYEDAAPTLRSDRHGLLTDHNIRIRKLTPLECWRLQGVPDKYFYRAAYGNEIPVDLVQKLAKRTMNREEYKQYSVLTRKRLVSDSQLYKQAGNACTVNVMYAIAKRMGYD